MFATSVTGFQAKHSGKRTITCIKAMYATSVTGFQAKHSGFQYK